jgi:hypothetical protein
MSCFSEFNKQFTSLFFYAVSKTYNRALTKNTVLTSQFYIEKPIQLEQTPPPPLISECFLQCCALQCSAVQCSAIKTRLASLVDFSPSSILPESEFVVGLESFIDYRIICLYYTVERATTLFLHSEHGAGQEPVLIFPIRKASP